MTREEAIAILKNEKPCNDKTLKYSDDVLILALDMAIEALNQQKEGEWCAYEEPWGGKQTWKCLRCGAKYDISKVYTIMPYNYCPNCGAKRKEVIE